jgi:hypothetical protein
MCAKCFTICSLENEIADSGDPAGKLQERLDKITDEKPEKKAKTVKATKKPVKTKRENKLIKFECNVCGKKILYHAEDLDVRVAKSGKANREEFFADFVCKVCKRSYKPVTN